MKSGEGKTQIVESYTGYNPPIDVHAAIKTLISYVPEKYLRRLDRIVLTNASGFSRKRRRQKNWRRRRKIRTAEALGSYHYAWKGEQPWIEILVDNTLEGYPLWWLKIPFLRDITLTAVLYHELGHHVQQVIKPEYREKEDVADTWKARFTASYYKNRYWYLMPVIIPTAMAYRIGKRMFHWFQKSNAEGSSN